MHFVFNEGSGGYSEYTPGYPAKIGCDKRHWELTDPWTPKGFRLAVATGETCPDFTPAPDEAL